MNKNESTRLPAGRQGFIPARHSLREGEAGGRG